MKPKQLKEFVNYKFYPLKLTVVFLTLLFQFCVFTNEVNAQSIAVKGKVTDNKGVAVANASIVVKGTTTGTSSNDAGEFSLNVKEGATLEISAVGFKDQSATVRGTTITITLQSSDAELEQIVVVGYGTQRKRDVTGSVVSVNDKALKEVPAANLQMALQGRAAGLEIQKVGTQPGAGAVIRIRGERSISGSNDPLIILDGIPFEGGNLNDINPDDVASIDVLKDASATAIYGSRGSNGVILVTTKKGASGESRLSLNSYYGISTVARRYEMMNSQEYMAMRDISSWTQGYDPMEIANIPKGVNTDWQDLMYENGFITDNNLRIVGGSNGNSYALSGGYYDEKTVVPGQQFKRYSLRASIDTKIGKHLKVGLNSLNSITNSNGSQFVNPMWATLAASPLMSPYNEDGSIVKSPYGNPDDKKMSYSPLYLKDNEGSWVDKVRRFRSFNSLYGELQLTKGLKYRLNVGLDFRQQENDQFRSSDTELKPSFFRPGVGNTASVNNAEGYGYTLENVITYDKTFGKHKLNVTGLYSIQKDVSHNTYVSKDSIDEDFIQFYNLGQSNASNTSKPTLGGGESTWGLESYMLRVNYAYSDKYLLTLTGRIDGSSRLAKGNKYHQYPAISAGWIISNEDFMKNQKLFDLLKLRVGWGETSNQSINPYASLGNIGNINDLYGTNAGGIIRYNYGPQVVTGYNVLNLPNPGLNWEFTRTLNVGLDFGLLNNRITGSLEYYNAHTNKILYGISLPPTSGITRPYTTNIGEMSNKGLELSVSTKNIDSKNGFSWSTDFNIFFNRNKLEKLTDGFSMNIASQLFLGQPLSAIYDYQKLGVWQIDEAHEAIKYGAQPGSIKLADLNNDGVIDANNDRKVIGSGQADWQGGMTNRFSYKGFDLSFVLYARMGGTLVSQIYQPYAAYINVMDGKRNNIKVDYWTPENPTNAFPSPIGLQNSTLGATTLGYYDASFIKMRSINLGYNVRKAVLDKLHIQNLRVYANVLNPFVLYSPYMRMGGVDPEATGTGSQGISNPGNLSSRALTINLTTPPTRTFMLGVNVTF